MEIFLKAQVTDQNGSSLGSVTNIVVSQSSRAETHFVFLYQKDHTERLAAVEQVEKIQPDTVQLKLTQDVVETLPLFNPSGYKEIDLFELDPDLHATAGKVLTLVPPAEQNISRRKFLSVLNGAIMGLIGLILAIPLVKYLTYPMYQGFKNVWYKIGVLSSITQENAPQSYKFIKVSRQAYMTDTSEKSHWVMKTSPEVTELIYADPENRVFMEKNGNIVWENKKESQLVVYSGKCPHLGCPYRWDEATKTFVCPCHNSVFKMTGEVISGPAPRRLDVLPVKVEGDEILVIDAEYRAGIKAKERIA